MDNQKFELQLTVGPDGSVVTNAAEICGTLKANLKKYDYIVDESNIADAKKDRAALNHLKDDVARERKAKKDFLLQNWYPAENAICDLESIISAASRALDDGIKAVEKEQKSQKEAELRKIWEDIVGDTIVFEKIFDKKWLNKTCDLRQAEEQMKKKASEISAGWTKTIKPNLPNDPAMKKEVEKYYYQTLDLAMTVMKCTEYKNILEQQKKPLMPEPDTTVPIAETVHTPPENLAGNPHDNHNDITNNPENQPNAPQGPEKPEIWKRMFVCEGTPEQFQALSRFLKTLMADGFKCKVQK